MGTPIRVRHVGPAQSDPKRQKAPDKRKRFDREVPSESIDKATCPGVDVLKAHLHGSKTIEKTKVFPILLLGLKTASIEAEAKVETKRSHGGS